VEIGKLHYFAERQKVHLSFGGINNTWFQSAKAYFDCGFYLFLNFVKMEPMYGRRNSRLDIVQGQILPGH